MQQKETGRSGASLILKSPSKVLCIWTSLNNQLPHQLRLCLNMRSFKGESTAEQNTWGIQRFIFS